MTTYKIAVEFNNGTEFVSFSCNQSWSFPQDHDNFASTHGIELVLDTLYGEGSWLQWEVIDVL